VGGIDDFYKNTSPEVIQTIDKNIKEGGLYLERVRYRYASPEQDLSTFNLIRKFMNKRTIEGIPLQLVGRAYYSAIGSDLARESESIDIINCGILGSDNVAVGKIKDEYIFYPFCCFMIEPKLELGRVGCGEFKKREGALKLMVANYKKKVHPIAKNKFRNVVPSQKFYSLQKVAQPCEVCYQRSVA
jgi:hypothetical protein